MTVASHRGVVSYCQIGINEEIKFHQREESGRGQLPHACWWEISCKGIGAITSSFPNETIIFAAVNKRNRGLGFMVACKHNRAPTCSAPEPCFHVDRSSYMNSENEHVEQFTNLANVKVIKN